MQAFLEMCLCERDDLGSALRGACRLLVIEYRVFDRITEGQVQMGKLKNYKTSIDLPAAVSE